MKNFGFCKHSSKSSLDYRIDAIGWGVFFVMLGVLFLLDEYNIFLPKHTWLLGAGIIILTENAIRYFLHIKIELFILILGIVAFSIGFVDVLNYQLPLFPIILLTVGICIIGSVFLKKKHK